MEEAKIADGPPQQPKTAFEEKPEPPKSALPSKPEAPTTTKVESMDACEGQLLVEALGLSHYSFAIPANVYGTATMCGILFDHNTPLEWWNRCGETYLRMSINCVIQVGLLLAVYQINIWQLDLIDFGKDDGESCWRLTSFFFFLNLFIFCSVVLTEIFETADMFEIVIRRIPTVPVTKCLRYKEGEGDGGPVLVSGGMSVTRKVLTCTFVLGPKLILGVTMMIIGGIFLNSSSSNTDLLLNSLAAVFILDLDEIVYSFMTPGHTRRLIEDLPPFEAEANPHYDFLRATSFLWKNLLTIVLCILFYVTGERCDNDPCTGAKRTCPAVDFPDFMF